MITFGEIKMRQDTIVGICKMVIAFIVVFLVFYIPWTSDFANNRWSQEDMIGKKWTYPNEHRFHGAYYNLEANGKHYMVACAYTMKLPIGGHERIDFHTQLVNDLEFRMEYELLKNQEVKSRGRYDHKKLMEHLVSDKSDDLVKMIIVALIEGNNYICSDDGNIQIAMHIESTINKTYLQGCSLELDIKHVSEVKDPKGMVDVGEVFDIIGDSPDR